MVDGLYVNDTDRHPTDMGSKSFFTRVRISFLKRKAVPKYYAIVNYASNNSLFFNVLRRFTHASVNSIREIYVG